jgi:hypothetical protein
VIARIVVKIVRYLCKQQGSTFFGHGVVALTAITCLGHTGAHSLCGDEPLLVVLVQTNPRCLVVTSVMYLVHVVFLVAVTLRVKTCVKVDVRVVTRASQQHFFGFGGAKVGRHTFAIP